MNLLMRGFVRQQQSGLFLKNSNCILRKTMASDRCAPQECVPPPCPPKNYHVPPDPGNPCNYCPTDEVNHQIVRLKRLQCKYQADTETPIYLKSKHDVMLYKFTLFLVTLTSVISFYTFLKNSE